MHPTFSVVIPTHRRPGPLRACLEALARHDPDVDFELIVVADGPADGVPEVVAGFPRPARLLAQPHGGSGAARNTGARLAQGRFLAFTADDCLPAPDWLCGYARALEAEPEAMCGGAVENGLEEDAFARANDHIIRYLQTYARADRGDDGFYTPNNLALSRELFLRVGGFDASLGTTGEDRELCDRWLRRGFPLRATPEARVRHVDARDLLRFVHQHLAYGRGSCRFHQRRRARERRRLLGHPLPHPLPFYLGLVTSAAAGPPPDLPRTAAVLLAQAANTVGFLRESLRPAVAGISAPSTYSEMPLPEAL